MTRGSIIIVSWNGEAYLGSCLDAILAQTGSDDEIIVVDNGSTDDSVTLVRERYPRVHLIENGRNLGFAGGCNTGLRVAQGDVLFVVNQDAALRAGWLEVMCEALADRTVGVAGCKILYPDGRTIQHAGGIIRWPRAVPDHWGYGKQDEGLWDEPADVDYVTGAAWGFQRDLVEQAGELDEGYWPGYYEEVDYCFRAREAGLRVVYVPAAQATHVESTTLGQGSEAFYRAFHRGRLRFVLKRLSPERFLRDFVPAEQSWLKEELVRNERLAMGQVYLAALLMVPAIYAAREEAGLPAFDVLQQVTEALANLRAEVWRRSSSPQAPEEPGGRSL
jgi:GT2 family glycosyltransferase